MKNFPCIGVKVLYFGDLDPSDYFSQKQMLKYLKTGSWYTISNIGLFDTGRHYQFLEGSTGGLWYPSICFKADRERYMKKKYGLR